MAQDNDAARLRSRAERLRLIAGMKVNRELRDLFERIAREYDRMASNAEARAARQARNES